jgi:hypothetical protein
MFRPNRLPTSNGADGSPQDHEVHASSEPSSAEMAARLAVGLERLLRAHDYADDLGCDVWDFAVEIRDLRSADMTTADFRWLTRKGYVEHARDVTLPGEEVRSFRRSQGQTFTKKSCFALTKRGAVFVRQLLSTAKAAQCRGAELLEKVSQTVRSVVPEWDRDLQELRFDGQTVKQFKVPAPNQEVILAAFEEEGWPPRIDDPLPPQADQDPKRRLHGTINSLNRNHKVDAIRFIGDGSGLGVRWTLVTRHSDASGE